MNRLYTIIVGAHVVKGLISPGELPDLKTDFIRMASQYGAIVDFSKNRLRARKGGLELVFILGGYHCSMPGLTASDSLSREMKELFT